MAVHPLHDIILSGGDDMQIKLWGTASDTPLHQFEARLPEQGAVLSLAIRTMVTSPSLGATPASNSGDQINSHWCRDDFHRARTRSPRDVLRISAVAFSGDDRFALSAEFAKANLRRVDRENPEENLVTALEGHAAESDRWHSLATIVSPFRQARTDRQVVGSCRRCCRNRRYSDVSRDAVMTVVSSNSKWGSMLSLFLFAESGRPRSCWKWLP